MTEERGCLRSDGVHKKRFKRLSAARRHARQAGARLYRCPSCGWYHLTTLPQLPPSPLKTQAAVRWEGATRITCTGCGASCDPSEGAHVTLPGQPGRIGCQRAFVAYVFPAGLGAIA